MNQNVILDVDQGIIAEITVALRLNKDSPRHRDVLDGGALFGSFLGKQKGTTKIIIISTDK